MEYHKILIDIYLYRLYLENIFVSLVCWVPFSPFIFFGIIEIKSYDITMFLDIIKTWYFIYRLFCLSVFIVDFRSCLEYYWYRFSVNNNDHWGFQIHEQNGKKEIEFLSISLLSFLYIFIFFCGYMYWILSFLFWNLLLYWMC